MIFSSTNIRNEETAEFEQEPVADICDVIDTRKIICEHTLTTNEMAKI